MVVATAIRSRRPSGFFNEIDVSGHCGMARVDFAVCGKRAYTLRLEKDRSPPEVGRPLAQVPTLLERN